MQRRSAVARRVRDGAQVEVIELVLADVADEAEVERIEALSSVSCGDSFLGQDAHERVRAERQPSEKRASAPARRGCTADGMRSGTLARVRA